MNSCKGVSNTVAVFDIFLWSNCHNQTLSIFFLFCQVVETPSWIFFSFAVGATWNAKIIFVVVSHSLLVNPTVTTSASVNPRNVKKKNISP